MPDSLSSEGNITPIFCLLRVRKLVSIFVCSGAAIRFQVGALHFIGVPVMSEPLV